MKIIINEKQLLKEDTLETILMAAGFVPVIGEIADIILIIRYILKKEYIYAVLMLIALIPTIGDMIAKPIILSWKGLRGASRVLKSTDDVAAWAIKNPKVTNNILKLEQHLPAIENKVTQLSKQLDKIPAIGKKSSSGLNKGVVELKTLIGKLKSPSTVKSTTTTTSASTKSFSDWFKDRYRGKALSEYIAKTGMKPSNWVSNWWSVVRRGRKMRRNEIKRIIMASNLLNFLGLPSFESFERKIETDENLRTKLAQNPEFPDIVNQTTTQDDINNIESSQSKSGEGMGGLFGGVIGLQLIKQLAKTMA